MMEEQVQKKYIHRDFSHSTHELLSFLVERVQENICKELEESQYGLISADFLCTLLGIRQEATSLPVWEEWIEISGITTVVSPPNVSSRMGRVD